MDFKNGMIFVCDERTVHEMFQHKIFGLPPTYLREMKQLVPEKSALFLLEKNTGVIRGIFTPTSTAKKLIVPNIWQFDVVQKRDAAASKCAFPSQIRFRLHSSFRALPKDSDFAPMFLRRMKIKGKFLDRMRVRSLVSALTNHDAVQRQQTEDLAMLFRNYVLDQYPPVDFFNPSGLAYLQRQNDMLRAENRWLRKDQRAYSDYSSPVQFSHGHPDRSKLPYNVNAIAHFKNQSPPDFHSDINELFEEENLPSRAQLECPWVLESRI